MRVIEGTANPAIQGDRDLNAAQVGIVLVLGMLARGFVIWHVIADFSAQWFFHRGMEMGLLAQSVLEGNGLSSPFGWVTGPTALIAPGYPLFVSLIFAVFGSYSTLSAIVIMAIHATLNLITVLLIMILAQRFTSARAAMLGGLFCALWPSLIWLPTIFWDTSFSCCIMIASVAWVLGAEHAPSRARFVLSGVFIALAGLINPALMPALIAMILWAGYRHRRGHPYGFVHALAALLIVFSFWPLRNMRVFHALIPLRSTIGFELWMGNRAESNGFLDESVFPAFNRRELQKYISEGEVAYVRQKTIEAKSYISSHRLHFCALSFCRVFRFWTGSGNRTGSPLFIVHACVTSLFGLMGLVVLARRCLFSAVLIAIPLLIFPLPYYITHAEYRYRLVVDPVLTMLSACALGWLSERRTKAQ